jgi:hypothetical protein
VRATDAFLVAFLAVQVLLPVRGFVQDKRQTRGNFTWNMYSKDYDCTVEYDLVRPDGTSESIRLGRFFNRRSHVNRVYHRRMLPEFHRWLCDHFREEQALGEIHGRLDCSLNGGPETPLVQPGVDICTAPDHGVTSP